MVKKVGSSQPFVDAFARKYRNELRASMPPPSAQREAALPSAEQVSSRFDPSSLVGDVDLSGPSFMDKLGDPNSGPGKVIDVISQPLYAMSQHFAETKDAIEDEGVAKGLFGVGKSWAPRNPLSSKAHNLGTGNTKKTASDILRNEEFVMDDGERWQSGNDVLAANESDDNWNKAAKIGGSLALDIAADPLTYVPGAAFLAVGKGAKAAVKAPLSAAARSGNATVASVGSAGLRAGHAAGAPGRALSRAVTPKKKKNLAEETGEFTAAAAKLSPAASARLEELMEKAAAKTATEDELVEVSALTGASFDEVADVSSKAAGDAEKINEGTFVPKVKIRPNEVQGPKQAILKGPSGKTQAYDELLTSVLRKTKDPDAPLMYPKLADAELKAPFTTFGAKKVTPKEEAAVAAAKVVEPEPVVVDDIIEQADEVEEVIPARPPAVTDIRASNMLNQMVKAKPDYKAPDGFTVAQHMALSTASSAKGRELLTQIWKQYGMPGKPNDADIVRARRNSQDMMNMLKANILAKQQGLPAPYPGGRMPQGAPSGAQNAPVPAPKAPEAPEAGSKIDNAAEKIADKVEKAKATAEVKTPVKKPDIRPWSGKVKTQYVNKLMNQYGIHPIHVAELMAAPTKSAFTKRLNAMKTWKTTGEPHYKVIELVIESPTTPSILADAKPGVITASEQIEEGVAGGKTAAEIAEDSASGLSTETLDAWRWAASDTPVTQNWTGIDESLKWKSLVEKTLRDNPQYRQGYGVNREAANAKFQANVFRSVVNAASKEAKAAGLKGAARAEYMRTFSIKAMQESDAKLRSIGIQPIATYSKTGWPVSLGDVFGILNDFPAGRRFLDGRVFDGFGKELVGARKVAENSLEGTIKADALLSAVRPILDVLFKEVPELADVAALSKTVKKIAREGVSAKLVKAVKDEAKSLPITSLGKQADGTYGVKPLGPVNADKVATEVTEILLDPTVVKGLFQAAHNNAATAGIVFGQRVNAISEEAIARVVNILGDKNAGTRSIAEAISPAGKKEVLTQAKATTEVGKTDALLDAVSAEKFDEIITEVISVSDLKSAEYLVEVARAVEKGDNPARLAAIQKQYSDAVSEGFHAQAVATLMNSGESSAIAMNSGIGKLLQPLASRFLNHWDNPTIHAALMKQGNVGRVFQGIVRRNLNDISRQFSKEELVAGFNLIQKGLPLESAGRAGEAATALQNNVDILFRSTPANDPKTTGLFSEFMAKGFDIDHVLTKMEHGRIAVPEKYRFDKAKAADAAKANGTTVQHELSKQWQAWDVEDPIEFLAQMSTVMGGLATDSAVAMEGLRIAKSLNMASSVPRKGMVRYVPDPKHNVLSKYFPEGTYFDKEVVSEFKKMDEILSDSARVHWFVDNVLSPITQRWKAGMTIYHLGHHTRNLVGDTAMSFLTDGVKSPVYYNRAARMMGPGNIRGAYTEWDAVAAMRGVSHQATAGKHAAKVKIGRREEVLSDIDVQRLAMNQGILPDFAVQEDILDTVRSGPGASFAKGVDTLFDKKSPFKGRVRKVAGKLSEARDDYVRMAHFMHVLEHPPKGGYKSLDHAVEYAAARVRKAHPDGSDLTSMERQLRVIFPFYSWTRKAIPLVIESIMIQPARVNMYPKAMYGWAQSNGLDVESLSEPFPEDRLYPSFLKDNTIGPQWEDADGNTLGMDFGFPQVDIMDDFFAKPHEGVASMLNPLIKAPVELSTSGKIFSEAGINNKGEYIEGNIPGMSQAAQLTGYSPINSVMEGTPTKQTTVVKGNKQAMGEGDLFGFDPRALVNRTLNVGYTNYETPSYRNIAEMEKRDAALEARKKALKEIGRE